MLFIDYIKLVINQKSMFEWVQVQGPTASTNLSSKISSIEIAVLIIGDTKLFYVIFFIEHKIFLKIRSFASIPHRILIKVYTFKNYNGNVLKLLSCFHVLPYKNETTVCIYRLTLTRIVLIKNVRFGLNQ